MSWYAKTSGGYPKESAEAHNNATEIFNILKTRGWTDNAIYACLGNLDHEGQYNPWRWESDNVPTYEEYQSWDESEQRRHGYGMWGFTPASKYIASSYARSIRGYAPNFSNLTGGSTDGYAQTYFMDSGGSGWIVRERFNNMTFAEFKTSNQSLYTAVKVFLYCFENPANPELSLQSRYEAALYWQEYFTGVQPQPDPDPPDPDPDPPAPVFISDLRRWKFYLF